MDFTDGRVGGVERYGRFDTGGKMVMNDNQDLTNVLPEDQRLDVIIDTLTNIYTILANHCGPDSTYAMIVTGSGNSEFEPNIFTKDGIKILSHLEYVSPIQTYIKELICYIGRRVDSAAKDGTTTSMMIAASFLEDLCQMQRRAEDDVLEVGDIYDLHPAHVVSTVTTRDIERIYNDMIKTVVDILMSKARVTIDDIHDSHTFTLEKTAGHLAFMQAMSSSGGNVELAKVNRQLFMDTPKELWNRITMVQSTIETDTAYSIRYQESQYKLMCNMLTEIRNTDLGTRYVEENVLLFAYPDAINAGTVVLDRILDFIHNAEPDQALAIVAQSIDSKLVTYVEKLNKEREKPITLYINLEKVKYGNDSWDLMAINAMAGRYSYSDRTELIGPLDIERHCIMVPRLEMNFTHLELFDFYEVVDKDSNIHPYYTNREAFPPYTEFIDNLNKVIERDATAHVHNNQLIETAYRVFSQMVCRRVPQLVIGGSTHENIANMTVAQDVIGATMSTIRDGFFASGLLSVYHYLSLDTTRDSVLDITQNTHDCIIAGELLQMLRNAMKYVIHMTYTPYINSHMFCTDRMAGVLDGHIDDTYEYINGHSLRGEIKTHHEVSELSDLENSYGDLVGHISEYINAIATDAESNSSYICDNYPPIQPVAVYTELFKRMGELLLKVNKTGSIMVPGGVFINKE